MARTKGKKNKVKETVKVGKIKVSKEEESIAVLEKRIAERKAAQKAKEVKEALNKRAALIETIRSKLMPNRLLKQGGFGVRQKYEQEKAEMNSLLEEVNQLGAIAMLRPIGLGSLRK